MVTGHLFITLRLCRKGKTWRQGKRHLGSMQCRKETTPSSLLATRIFGTASTAVLVSPTRTRKKAWWRLAIPAGVPTVGEVSGEAGDPA